MVTGVGVVNLCLKNIIIDSNKTLQNHKVNKVISKKDEQILIHKKLKFVNVTKYGKLEQEKDQAHWMSLQQIRLSQKIYFAINKSNFATKNLVRRNLICHSVVTKYITLKVYNDDLVLLH